MLNTRAKKYLPVTLLALFYCTAVIWGSFCIPMVGDASTHAHHKSQPGDKAPLTSHSISCQLACAGSGAASKPVQPLSSPLLLLAALLLIPFFNLYQQQDQSKHRTRAPPLFS